MRISCWQKPTAAAAAAARVWQKGRKQQQCSAPPFPSIWITIRPPRMKKDRKKRYTQQLRVLPFCWHIFIRVCLCLCIRIVQFWLHTPAQTRSRTHSHTVLNRLRQASVWSMATSTTHRSVPKKNKQVLYYLYVLYTFCIQMRRTLYSTHGLYCTALQ